VVLSFAHHRKTSTPTVPLLGQDPSWQQVVKERHSLVYPEENGLSLWLAGHFSHLAVQGHGLQFVLNLLMHLEPAQGL
jgi:hypothetical protein